jgi:hypothetical protein
MAQSQQPGTVHVELEPVRGVEPIDGLIRDRAGSESNLGEKAVRQALASCDWCWSAVGSHTRPLLE